MHNARQDISISRLARKNSMMSLLEKQMRQLIANASLSSAS